MGCCRTSVAALGIFMRMPPEKFEYAINRFYHGNQTPLDLLDQHLATHTFMVGNDYTIADMAIWAWYGQLALGKLYNAGEFLQCKLHPPTTLGKTCMTVRPCNAVTLPATTNCLKS